MSDPFEVALKFTLEAEGGYSNNPADPGGATSHGITQNTYSDWLKHHSMPETDVKSITMQEVHDIYHEWFWKLPNFDMLSAGVPATAIALFDWYLNVGHPKIDVVMPFQRRIGVISDGMIGAATARTALVKAQSIGGDLKLALTVNNDRRAFIEAKSKPGFQHGLHNRCDHLDEYLKATFAPEQVNNGTGIG